MSRLVLRKPKHVLDSDWTVVIKQPLRARPIGILFSYAKRTISEYSRENTALKKNASYYSVVVVRLSSLMVYIVLVVVVHHGCSSKLLGTHPTTIHYTPSRFILKNPGLQPNWEIHQNKWLSGI
jgi:hypothetical protein